MHLERLASFICCSSLFHNIEEAKNIWWTAELCSLFGLPKAFIAPLKERFEKSLTLVSTICNFHKLSVVFSRGRTSIIRTDVFNAGLYIFAQTASWYAKKFFIIKLPLKWGIVGLCTSNNTHGTGQNVFSIKLQFSRFCIKNSTNFFAIIFCHGAIES